MKKSELIARYQQFGRDINVIEHGQFFGALEENKNNLFIAFESVTVDCDTHRMYFGLDGCDYYAYSSSYNVGYEGVDCDMFCFNIVTMTEKEREDMTKLFSQRNNIEEFDIAIGGDDCELLH